MGWIPASAGTTELKQGVDAGTTEGKEEVNEDEKRKRQKVLDGNSSRRS